MPKRMIVGFTLTVVGVILTFCSYSLPVEKYFWQKMGCLLVVTGIFLTPNWINKEE